MFFSVDDGYQFFSSLINYCSPTLDNSNKVVNFHGTGTYSQKIEPSDINLTPKALNFNNAIIISQLKKKSKNELLHISKL